MSDADHSAQPPLGGGRAVSDPVVRQLLLDLHDGPMQLIYAALLQLDLLQAALGDEGEPVHRATRLQALLERASVELRTIIDRSRAPTESPDLLSMLREVGAQQQSSLFARLAASTLAIQFGLQCAINLAVNLSLIPPKGMTLPFVSYGGTSMFAIAFGMGLMLAFTRKKPEERLATGLPVYRSGVLSPAE